MTAEHLIGYSDIDLDKTEKLLKLQGSLNVELSPFRAKTMIMLLNIEKEFKSIEYKKQSKIKRLFGALFDIIYTAPFTLLNSNVVVLHCIFVNNCTNSAWEKLQNGNYKFTFS